jgi:solute carrier family 25 uncoupling protein 8/9
MQSGKRKEGESATYFFMKNVACGAVSACWAEFLTIPADTAKVRLQIQKNVPGQEPKYKGMYGTASKIAAEEGFTKLWGGIVPGL